MEKNTARKVDREYSGELRLNWASQGGTLNTALKNKRERAMWRPGASSSRGHSRCKYPET